MLPPTPPPTAPVAPTRPLAPSPAQSVGLHSGFTAYDPGTDPGPAPAGAPANKALLGGTYELGKEIGSGGMGIVYEARDVKLDRKVAIKELRREVAKGGRGRERFLEEARLVARLSHPNIVTIHQIIEENDKLFLVFEFVDGITLDRLIESRKRLAPADALKLLAGVAAAIDYAHSQKVIHRDLKPGNIIVDWDNRARVMDFGIAHQAKMTVSRMTNADAFGTHPYMPPEQSLGQAVRESDVYSFAAMTYETLTGELPFPGPDFHLQKMSMTFRRPSEVLGSPKPLDEAFERALQPEAKKRFATTGEFLTTVGLAVDA